MRSRLLIFGVFVALFGAIARAQQFAIEWQALQPVAGIYIIISPFLALLHLFLILSFLVSGIGLLLHLVQKRTGLIISISGVIGVLLGHIEWYAFTRQSLPTFENGLFRAQRPDLSPPHLLGLIGARWWDIGILLCAAILLIWEVKMLLLCWAKTKN